MDPYRAISLAVSVIQFIGFSHRLVSKGNKICPSTKETFLGNMELDSANRLLLEHVSEIHRFFKIESDLASHAYREMKEICFQYEEIAKKLVKVLENLKFRARRKKWTSMRQAFKAMISKEEVWKLAHRLNELRADLDKILLSSVRYDKKPQLSQQ